MRQVIRWSLFLVSLAGALSSCDDPCEPKPGLTNCAYCGEDRAVTRNRHAGICRYCPGQTACLGDTCSDDLLCVDRVFLFVPGAVFRPGPPASTASSGTLPQVSPETQPTVTLSPGASSQWRFTWSAVPSATTLRFQVPQLDGGFELLLDDSQRASGAGELTLTQGTEAPDEAVCRSSETCWVEAPPETTTTQVSVDLVDAEGAAGPAWTGGQVDWSSPSRLQILDYSLGSGGGSGGSGGGSGASGCPSSGAQLGCCTTRGGIQVIGFGLSSACSCPAVDTCQKTPTYCGCKGCGGC